MLDADCSNLRGFLLMERRTQINTTTLNPLCFEELLMGTQGHNAGCGNDNTFLFDFWTGSTLERFPSGLWRKSCDLHWHLMNDISAYVLYQITQNANLNGLILLRYCSYQTKSKVYHSLYGIPYSSSSYLSKDEDYILPVSDCLLPKA